MPKFKKNPSPFMMKGMSFKEGQAPMKSVLGKLGEAWKKFKDSDAGKRLSAGLSAAGESGFTPVSEGEIIDTRGAGGEIDDTAPDVTTIIASSGSPIRPIEEEDNPITKKGKSPYRDYKKGYYGIK